MQNANVDYGLVPPCFESRLFHFWPSEVNYAFVWGDDKHPKFQQGNRSHGRTSNLTLDYVAP